MALLPAGLGPQDWEALAESSDSNRPGLAVCHYLVLMFPTIRYALSDIMLFPVTEHKVDNSSRKQNHTWEHYRHSLLVEAAALHASSLLKNAMVSMDV